MALPEIIPMAKVGNEVPKLFIVSCIVRTDNKLFCVEVANKYYFGKFDHVGGYGCEWVLLTEELMEMMTKHVIVSLDFHQFILSTISSEMMSLPTGLSINTSFDTPDENAKAIVDELAAPLAAFDDAPTTD